VNGDILLTDHAAGGLTRSGSTTAKFPVGIPSVTVIDAVDGCSGRVQMCEIVLIFVLRSKFKKR